MRDGGNAAFTSLAVGPRDHHSSSATGEAGAVNIVSIAPFMPFRGVPHAGGEFYRRHAELVAESNDLLVVAPRTSDNESAIAHDTDALYRRVLVTPRKSGNVVLTGLYYVLARTVPFLAVRPFWQALAADQDLQAALRQADRIELQWFNALVLAPRLRQAFPTTRIVGVFHDVVSQGQRRMLRTPGVGPRWRFVALAQLLLAVPLERWVLRALDTAVVLSEKDRALLERRCSSARIVVVSPPLDDEDMPSAPQSVPLAPPQVLFVGALDRVENQDAARWLLDEIWPRVQAEVPDARLTIAGAKPSRVLIREVERLDSVELTGYVPSLAPYYKRASVVVAPMRVGAGVKLKSLIAMLWGLPVVATRVAAEGVTGPGVFFAVEDDSEEFSRAVVAVLKDPTSASGVCARAYAWAHNTYSTARYRTSVEVLYPTARTLDGGHEPRAASEET